jgi:hypothetical protein
MAMRLVGLAALLLSTTLPRVHGQEFYQHKYAVVVGIDKYKTKPKLRYARNDAEGMAKLLKNQGFEVVELYDQDATREEINDAMEETVASKIKEKDCFVFFYSGHGTTESFDGHDYGYLVPFDATDKKGSLLSMEALSSLSAKLGRGLHQLFLMDCCYGGLTTTRNVREVSPTHPHYLQELSRRKARRVITAGGKDQQVVDFGTDGHSLFTGALLNGIDKGLADLNGDGYVTAAELAAYLQSAASNSFQTPGDGVFPGDELGETIFKVPENALRQPQVGTAPAKEANTIQNEQHSRLALDAKPLTMEATMAYILQNSSYSWTDIRESDSWIFAALSRYHTNTIGSLNAILNTPEIEQELRKIYTEELKRPNDKRVDALGLAEYGSYLFINGISAGTLNAIRTTVRQSAEYKKIHGVSEIASASNTTKPGIVGIWDWGYLNGRVAQLTTVFPDHSVSSSNNTTGRWEILSESDRKYRIRWDQGNWINDVELSLDGNTLSEMFEGKRLERHRSKIHLYK